MPTTVQRPPLLNRAPTLSVFALTALAIGVAAFPAAAAEPAAAQVELIAREALFGNPERANVQISPDGRTLSWVAPVDGVLNLWVAPADHPEQAKAVTDDKARGIRQYFWSYRPGTLLYLRDTGGDEDFHLYALDLATGTKRDLSPFPKTRAQVNGVSHLHPESVMVAMNDRDPKWHDLYRVDLGTGTRTLVEKNVHEIAGYLTDAEFEVRMAQRSRADGGARPAEAGWQAGLEQIRRDPVRGLADHLSRWLHHGRQDAVLHRFARARHRRAVCDRCRQRWTTPAAGRRARRCRRRDHRSAHGRGRCGVGQLPARRLAGAGPVDPRRPCHIEGNRPRRRLRQFAHARRHTWVVGYAAAESSPVYYRYDRAGGGTLVKLFAARPALEGKPLVPMWPQQITSRDGLTLVSYLSLPRGPTPTMTAGPTRRCRWCWWCTAARGGATTTVTPARRNGWPTAATRCCR